MKNKAKKPMELYVHIPFCVKKCDYCDFLSGPAGKERQREYFQSLGREIAAVPEFPDREITTVFIGGGTPSVPDPALMGAILDQIRNKFFMAPDAEITIEANPGTLYKEKLQEYRKHGVNRLSLGLQSPQNRELKILGRIHTWEEFLESFFMAREAGFSNISLDLIYGLPGQTMEQWKDSVEQIIALEPQHISAYALKLEKGTPLYEENPELPSEDVQADMYFYAVERLEQAGFEQYEISNFAQKGYRSRHNSRYWDLSQYLGFGPSAHSFFGGRRFSFIADTQGYIDGVEGNGPLLEEAEEVASFHRHGEYIMLKLRTTDGVDEEEFYRRFRLEFTPYAQRLSKYIQAGYCQNEGGVWRLTPKGMMVSNGILTDVLESELL